MYNVFYNKKSKGKPKRPELQMRQMFVMERGLSRKFMVEEGYPDEVPMAHQTLMRHVHTPEPRRETEGSSQASG